MKAFQLQEFGGPDAPQAREDVPDPIPGPGEVLIRVAAVSLNYRDLLMCRGTYNPKLKLPYDPGLRRSRAKSSPPVRVSRGSSRETRLSPAFMPDWVDGPPDDEKGRSALGAGGVGMLAELAVLPEHGLVPMPVSSHASRKPPPCRARA